MKRRTKAMIWAYAATTLAILALGVARAISAPASQIAGPAQKLVFLHVPVAINALLAAFIVFVASVGYVAGRRPLWDRLARSAAEVTVLNASVLLITGMFWARVAWGHWWVWSPRLTFSLVLWVLYATHVLLRARLPDPARRETVCSIYGIVAFLDVPLIYLSVKLLPDVHPATFGFSAAATSTLILWTVGITMLSLGTIAIAFIAPGPSRNGSRPSGLVPPTLRPG